MKILLAVLLSGAASAAVACSTPMFRFALERWEADPYRLIIFTDEELTADQQQAVTAFRQYERYGFRNPPLVVEQVEVSKVTNLSALVWAEISTCRGAPSVALLYPSVTRNNEAVWNDKLSVNAFNRIIMSPARLETATRLLGGDAAVWLLFRGKYPEENRAVRDLLDEELSALGKSIVYNEDFLQLAKEAGVEVPALMFSVLEVDPDDPQEAVLMAILTRLFPEAAAQSGPVVVPVFGQGRGAVLMMDELIAGEYIRDVAEFLIGACSCEVKELNPGFDLFIPVDWIGGITQEYVFDAELPPLTSPSAGMGALPGAANRTFGTAEQAGHRLFGAVLGISIVIVLGGLVGATWMLLRKNRNHESF